MSFIDKINYFSFKEIMPWPCNFFQNNVPKCCLDNSEIIENREACLNFFLPASNSCTLFCFDYDVGY